MRIAIIEDEKPNARELSRTIKSIDDSIEVIPFISSAEDLAFFLEQEPNVDLIFSDIDLGDGLSIDVFNKVKPKIPVVFCTAFDQYMLQAFKANGIDYILKPFKKSDVELALEKWGMLKGKSQVDLSLSQNAKTFSHSTSERTLLISKADKIIPIPIASIAYFFIENGLVWLVTAQERYICNQQLEELEVLVGTNFFRVNRQYLINKTTIKSVSRYLNRKLLINLNVETKEQVLVGKLKSTQFLTWLEASTL